MSKNLALLLSTITLLSGVALASSHVSAEDPSVVDEINITVPIACTMSGAGMESHNAEIVNGTYTPDIGSTTLHAFCNDNEGFAIYAAGYTGNEVGGTNSNKLVGTTASNNATIESGIATSAGNPDVSNWAMKLTMTQDSGDTTTDNAFTIDSAPNEALPSQAESGATQASFSNYHVVPNEYVKVAHKNSTTDMTASTGGVKLTTTYAAYISKTQPADTYSGQVKYTLLHPASSHPLEYNCEPGKICYSANASNVVGTMGQQDLRAKDWSSCNTYTDYATTCVVDDEVIDINTLPYIDDSYVDNVTLFASNFKREGYGFAGWNDSYDMTGTTYGPNQNIAVPSNIATEGLSLYAHWVESSGNLQGWTGCSALSQNQVIGLTDIRDGNVYVVAKLADGNCWMIENLRLSSSNITLSDTNTDNPAPGFTSLPASSDEWCDDWAESCIDQSKLNSNNTTMFTNNTISSQNSSIYSYGNYYNWYTATAGTGTTNTTSEDATGSICPNGWQLPSGYWNDSNKGQFSALDLAIGGTGNYQDAGIGGIINRWQTYPNNYVYVGDYAGDQREILGRGGDGLYWSRTPINGGFVRYLELSSGYIYPGNGDFGFGYGRKDGYAVRCLTLGSYELSP